MSNFLSRAILEQDFQDLEQDFQDFQDFQDLSAALLAGHF